MKNKYLGTVPYDTNNERMATDMNEQQLKDQVIKEFVNLQRLKAAKDKEAEIAYQEKVLKVRMQSLGIPTEDLELN